MSGKQLQRAFTLVELLVVLMLVSILAAIVAPIVSQSIIQAKESALRENLYVIRKSIDDYYADKGHYPQRLEVLKQERYLRKLPQDPISESAWTLVMSESEQGGIIDIHSPSNLYARDGETYASW